MSKCFIKSKEESLQFNCISCHNPHISVKKTQHETFNKVCMNCHEHTNKNQIACTEKLSTRKSMEDDCSGCHMKRSNTIDIPHVITTDHYIRKPVKKNEIEKIRKFLGLKCINENQIPKAEMARGYINYYEKFIQNPSYLDSASVYLNTNTKEDIRKNYRTLVHLNYLKNNYDQIIRYAEAVSAIDFLNKKSWSNDDAYACYRTADAYISQNKPDMALAYLKRATELAPYIAEISNRYGNLMGMRGDAKAAEEIYRKTVQEHPSYAPALTNLGYMVLLNHGAVEEAEKLYSRALQIDPDYKQATLNMAGLYIYEKKYADARKILNIFISKNPLHNQAKEILKSIAGLNGKKNHQ